MKVILARTAGFCMGVRRAMNAVIEATHHSREKVYTLGPLVHNNQAVEMLRARNVHAVEDAAEVEKGLLFIRAHGVPPDVLRACRKEGVTVSDMTCPHVRRAQKIVEDRAREGYDTIIAGDRNHAEVAGLLGRAAGRGYVVETPEEVEDLPADLGSVCLVAQTTQSARRFEEIAKAVRDRFPGAVIHNTICSATDDRQNEVRELAARVDAMIVVGGRHSANTVRLAAIAEEEGVPTFHIETAADLAAAAIRDYRTIGVTAGASTPHWVFQSVVEKIHSISRTRSLASKILMLPFIIGVQTYLFLGAGSAAMTYAALRFLDIRQRWSYLFLSFLYVTSMHILNRLTDRAAAQINNPLRMELFRRLSPFIAIFSVACAAGALVLASLFGPLPALLMGASLAAGIGYNVRLFPERIGRTLGFNKLRELKGSKDIFAAAAWATATVLLPCLAERKPPSPAVAFAFLFVFLIVFNRFLVFDLKDIEGDRLVGKETLPLMLGGRGTARLLFFTTCGLAVLVLAHVFFGEKTLSPAAMAVAVAWSAACALFFRGKSSTLSGVVFELVVDAQFIVMGILSRLM